MLVLKGQIETNNNALTQCICVFDRLNKSCQILPLCFRSIAALLNSRAYCDFKVEMVQRYHLPNP